MIHNQEEEKKWQRKNYLELFERFMEAYIFASGIYETEIYRHGAAFGIKLTAEAFLLGKE